MARMRAAVDAAHDAQGAVREASDADPVTEPLPGLRAAVADQDRSPARAQNGAGRRGAARTFLARDSRPPAQSGRSQPDDAFSRDVEPGTQARQDRTSWWDWEHDAQPSRTRWGLGAVAAPGPGLERPSKPEGAVKPQLVDRLAHPAAHAPAHEADPAPSSRPAVTAIPATPVPPESGGRPLTSRAGPRSRPAAGIVALATVLIAGGVAAFVLSSGDNAARSSGNKAPTNQPGTRLARYIGSAAAWVAAQVSRTDVVSCDPAMCKALGQHGFPARQLLQLGPNAPYPLKSAIVVVTPVLLHQFGTSLAANWAPAVLAGFGRGADQVTVRVMAPQGALAYDSALRADRTQRRALGTGLLTSRQITTTPAARSAMADGDVDARLLIVITAVASQHPIDILAFGGTWSGSAVGIPLRTADFAEDVPAAHMSEAEYAQAVIDLLRAQPAAYRPVHIATIRFAGRNALQIEFPAPSPLGLISPVH